MQQDTSGLASYWDSHASLYAQIFEYHSNIFSIPLFHHTRAYDSKIHLDVGCGSGLGVLELAAIMKPETGHLIVASDISSKMLLELQKRLTIQDIFNKAPNSFKMGFSGSQGEESEPGVHIRAVLANNQALPFQNQSFDSYTSNLSLMIVDNHFNQLKQAHRVLKPGGAAGFSVWGRSHNSSFFTILTDSIVQAGFELPKKRSNFHLGSDPNYLTEEAKKAGFNKAVAWYQPSVSNFRTPDEYFETMILSPSFDWLSEAERVSIKQKFLQQLQEKRDSSDFAGLEFEGLLMVAFK